MKFFKPSNIKALLLFTAAVLLLELITYNFGGGKSCYLKGIIGVPCPGCGLTRSFVSLLHGDLYDAFFYHPLFPLIPAVFTALIIQKVTGSGSFIYNWIYIGTTVLFILVFIVRMLLFFPHTAPMDFNERSVLMKGYYLLIK
jgi:hypothetical protein